MELPRSTKKKKTERTDVEEEEFKILRNLDFRPEDPKLKELREFELERRRISDEPFGNHLQIEQEETPDVNPIFVKWDKTEVEDVPTEIVEDLSSYTLTSDYASKKRTFNFFNTRNPQKGLTPLALDTSKEYHELPHWLQLVAAIAINSEELVFAIKQRSGLKIFTKLYNLEVLDDKKIGLVALKNTVFDTIESLLSAVSDFAGGTYEENLTRALDPNNGLTLFEYCLGAHEFASAEILFNSGARIGESRDIQVLSGISNYLKNIAFDVPAMERNTEMIDTPELVEKYTRTFLDSMAGYTSANAYGLYARYTTFSMLHRLTAPIFVKHVLVSCLRAGDFMGAYIIYYTCLPSEYSLDPKSGLFCWLPIVPDPEPKDPKASAYAPKKIFSRVEMKPYELLSILLRYKSDVVFDPSIDLTELLEFADELLTKEVADAHLLVRKQDPQFLSFHSGYRSDVDKKKPIPGGPSRLYFLDEFFYPLKQKFINYPHDIDAFLHFDDPECSRWIAAHTEWDETKLGEVIGGLIQKPRAIYRDRMAVLSKIEGIDEMFLYFDNERFFRILTEATSKKNISRVHHETLAQILRDCPVGPLPVIAQEYITNTLISLTKAIPHPGVEPYSGFEEAVKLMIGFSTKTPSQDKIGATVIIASLENLDRHLKERDTIVQHTKEGSVAYITYLEALFRIWDTYEEYKRAYTAVNTPALIDSLVRAVTEYELLSAAKTATSLFRLLRKNNLVDIIAATTGCEYIIEKANSIKQAQAYIGPLVALHAPGDIIREGITLKMFGGKKWALLAYWIQKPFTKNYSISNQQNMIDFVAFAFKYCSSPAFEEVMHFILRGVRRLTDVSPENVYESMLAAALDAEKQIINRQWDQDPATVPPGIMNQWDRKKLAHVWSEVLDILPQWIWGDPPEALKKLEKFVSLTGLTANNTLYWNVLYCAAIVALDVEKVEYYFDTFRDTFTKTKDQVFENKTNLVGQGLLAVAQNLCIQLYQMGPLPRGVRKTRLLLKEGSTTEFDENKRSALLKVLGKHILATIKDDEKIKLEGPMYYAFLSKDLSLFSFFRSYLPARGTEKVKVMLYPPDWSRSPAISIFDPIIKDDDIGLMKWVMENMNVDDTALVDSIGLVFDSLLRGKKKVFEYLVRKENKTKLAKQIVMVCYKKFENHRGRSENDAVAFIKLMVSVVRGLIKTDNEISKMLAIFSNKMDARLAKKKPLPYLEALSGGTVSKIISYCGGFAGCGPLLDFWARFALFKFGMSINWTKTLSACFEKRDISLITLIVPKRDAFLERAMLSALNLVDSRTRTDIQEKLEVFAPDVFYRLELLVALTEQNLEKAKHAIKKGALVDMSEIGSLLATRWKNHPASAKPILERALSAALGVSIPKRGKTESE